MKNTKIKNLGQIRELLHVWDEVRQGILSGSVRGISAALKFEDSESIYLGGHYREDPQAALGAALKASAARTLIEDEPPRFQANHF